MKMLCDHSFVKTGIYSWEVRNVVYRIRPSIEDYFLLRKIMSQGYYNIIFGSRLLRKIIKVYSWNGRNTEKQIISSIIKSYFTTLMMIHLCFQVILMHFYWMIYSSNILLSWKKKKRLASGFFDLKRNGRVSKSIIHQFKITQSVG